MSVVNHQPIHCDITDDDKTPAYWWRGLTDMVGWIAFVCAAARLEMIEGGIEHAELVAGELIAPGHWRPLELDRG